MQLTPEQHAILNSIGNIKINAVAGSGKTTTIIEYARTRPATSKILYLVFNRSVKTEAQARFRKRGLDNVIVETAHSLAYKHIVFKHEYRVKNTGYKTSEIAALLGLSGNGQKHSEYIIANHINKLIACYCNSDKPGLDEVDYLATLSEPKSKTFVSSFYSYIKKKAVLLLEKMDKGKIEVTHDFYLKKFQLSAPKLNYDYILFDEGQDASGAMLDVFLKQKATKVIVGDANQQIYSWRQAINSLEKVPFTSYSLSSSFRFGTEIAQLAGGILLMKKHIGRNGNVTITGAGNSSLLKSKAILSRTNLGLLYQAIHFVTVEDIKHIYFEGNINSYTYADEGASLYDVLNLYSDKRHLIKDAVIKSMQSLTELEDYAKTTEDPQLVMMIKIVKDYGNEIYNILRKIKERHVEDREKAELIFSTVHRSKGMEYDEVYLTHDFVDEKKLKDYREKVNTRMTADKLNEEVNLLYVAATRARNVLHIPLGSVPEGFTGGKHVKIIVPQPDESEVIPETPPASASKKAYDVETVKKKYNAAYAPWNEDADIELRLLLSEGTPTKEIASHFGRTEGAILSRINKIT